VVLHALRRGGDRSERVRRADGGTDPVRETQQPPGADPRVGDEGRLDVERERVEALSRPGPELDGPHRSPEVLADVVEAGQVPGYDLHAVPVRRLDEPGLLARVLDRLEPPVVARL